MTGPEPLEDEENPSEEQLESESDDKTPCPECGAIEDCTCGDEGHENEIEDVQDKAFGD